MYGAEFSRLQRVLNFFLKRAPEFLRERDENTAEEPNSECDLPNQKKKNVGKRKKQTEKDRFKEKESENRPEIDNDGVDINVPNDDISEAEEMEVITPRKSKENSKENSANVRSRSEESDGERSDEERKYTLDNLLKNDKLLRELIDRKKESLEAELESVKESHERNRHQGAREERYGIFRYK